MADDDVAATLDELERKLKDLEEELGAVRPGELLTPGAVPSAPAPAPILVAEAAEAASAPAAPAPPTPASVAVPEPLVPPEPVADAGGAADAAQAAFARFHEALERSAQQAMVEHARLLEALRAATPASPVRGTPLDAVLLEGLVVVDAGPFPDIASLSGFEEALGRVPGVRELHVRSFDGARAVLEVTLGRPVALGGELRRTTALTLTTRRAGGGRLSVAIEPAHGQGG